MSNNKERLNEPVPHTKADAPDLPEAQRPIVTGDKGQDDVYATESNPGGLRYNEKPHKPGELPDHPDQPAKPGEPPISVGNT